jgi:hypothetical protein
VVDQGAEVSLNVLCARQMELPADRISAVIMGIHGMQLYQQPLLTITSKTIQKFRLEEQN